MQIISKKTIKNIAIFHQKNPAYTGLISVMLIIFITSTEPFKIPGLFYNKGFYWSILLYLCSFILHKKWLFFNIFLLFGLLFKLAETNEKTTLYYNHIKNLNDKVILIEGEVHKLQYYKKGIYSYQLKNVTFFPYVEKIPKSCIIKIETLEKLKRSGKIAFSGHIQVNEFKNSMQIRIKTKNSVTLIQETSFFNRIGNLLNKKITEALIKVKDLSSRAVLQALLLNEKHQLSKIQINNFRNAGLSHILALSGLHAAIVLSSLLFLLKPIPLKNNIKSIISIIFLWFFYLSAHMPPTLFRASTAATIMLGAKIFQRNYSSINSLGVAGILWLFFSPTDLFSVSFQLSFCATFVIITIIPLLQKPEDSSYPKYYRLLFKAITLPSAATVFILIFTYPITASNFNCVSVGSIIFNIPSLTLTTIAIQIAIPAIFLEGTFLGDFLINLAAFFVGIMIDLVTWGANFKLFFEVPKPKFYEVISLYILLFNLHPEIKNKRRASLICLISLMVYVFQLFIN